AILSHDSVSKIRASVVAPAFTWACSLRSGQLRAAASPMTDSKAPAKRQATPPDILEIPREVATFIRCAWRRDPDFAAMVAVVAATGLRWEEITAVMPHHVI